MKHESHYITFEMMKGKGQYNSFYTFRTHSARFNDLLTNVYIYSDKQQNKKYIFQYLTMYINSYPILVIIVDNYKLLTVKTDTFFTRFSGEGKH